MPNQPRTLDNGIIEGDTVTGTTQSGQLVTGSVTGIYDTDAEGRSLTGGRRLTVMVDGRERAMQVTDVLRHVADGPAAPVWPSPDPTLLADLRTMLDVGGESWQDARLLLTRALHQLDQPSASRPIEDQPAPTPPAMAPLHQHDMATACTPTCPRHGLPDIDVDVPC